MIKINHLNKSSMDLVMKLSREFKDTPENIIKNILNTVNYNEAKRAINEYKNTEIQGEKEPSKK